MFGLGTIVNTLAIIAGGISGNFIGKLLNEKQRGSLIAACGISVLFIGISGAMEGMLKIEENALGSGNAMKVVICIALGTVLGELIGIEDLFERFGEWLKKKSGNSKDAGFVNAFVNASFTVCIGAMAIVGAIQDGISNDPTTLCTKAILDFIIIAVMSSSLGKGAVFSFLPVFLFQGSITLLARLIAPVMSDLAVNNLSLVGSILIFCVGVNLVWGKKVSVANMLPAVLIAVVLAYLPF